MGFFFAEVEEGNGNDVVDDDDDDGDDDDRGGGGQCGRSKAEVGRDEGRIIWSAVDDQKSGIYKSFFLLTKVWLNQDREREDDLCGTNWVLRLGGYFVSGFRGTFW